MGRQVTELRRGGASVLGVSAESGHVGCGQIFVGHRAPCSNVAVVRKPVSRQELDALIDSGLALADDAILAAWASMRGLQTATGSFCELRPVSRPSFDESSRARESSVACSVKAHRRVATRSFC